MNRKRKNEHSYRPVDNKNKRRRFTLEIKRMCLELADGGKDREGEWKTGPRHLHICVFRLRYRKEAEGNSKESQLMYENLKEEFIEKFWEKSISFERSAEGINPINS